jgi:hypothetical protein
MSLGVGTLVSRRDGDDGAADLLISFDGDNAYPAGGTLDFTAYVRDIVAAVAAAATDKNVRGAESLEIDAVIPQNCGQYVPSFDKAADTLFVQDGGHATWAEVAPATDLSGTTFNLVVLCK